MIHIPVYLNGCLFFFSLLHINKTNTFASYKQRMVKRMFKQTIINILVHRLRISEVLPCDRKYYLASAILPRLSREGYIHWLHWNSRIWSPSDVIVMLK